MSKHSEFQRDIDHSSGFDEIGHRALVYLAGPYSIPDPELNVKRIIALADELLDDGVVVPLVPHLTHLWDEISPRPVDDWYAYDLELLARCDALLRIPGESIGADREEQFARYIAIPTFCSKSTLYKWADSRLSK
jgi:hypothetical protein